MLEVSDYSHLSPEEAREKIIILCNRVYAEQFHEQFFIKDIRPEFYLKYEIAAFLEGRIQEIHGWTNPLGQALDSIRKAIISWFRSFYYSVILPGFRAVVGGFKWIWDSAVSFARNAYEQTIAILRFLKNIRDFMISKIYGVLSRVLDGLLGVYDFVAGKFAEAGSAIHSQLVKVWQDYIRPGIAKIFEGFRWLWERAVDFAQMAANWGRDIFNSLQNVWNGIVERVSGAFEALTKQIAAVPQAIASAFGSALSVLNDIAKAIWENVLVPFGQTLKGAFQAITSGMERVFLEVWNSFHSILEGFAPVTPEKSGNLGLTLLKIAGLSAGGLLSMSAVWDLMHPIKDIIPGEIKAMFYDITNFKLILGALAGSLVYAAITRPARYSYNAMLRPMLPEWRDVMELRSRRFISDEDFVKMMKYHGYDPSWKEWFDELANTPVRYFALAAVARTGYYDEDFFKEELNRSGYAESAKRIMLQMYAQLAKEAVRGQYASVVIRRYRAGIIDLDGLDNELNMLGYPERLRGPLKVGAQLYYDLDTVEDYVDALRFAYRRGKITIDELRSKLASLGIRSDRIERIVAIELARAKEDVYQTEEEEVRAYGRGTAIRRFREGITTEAELEQELRILGYSPQWIERLKTVARLERDYDFAMTVLKYVKTAYRKRKIDDVRFIEILRSFGFVEERIMLELDLMKLAYGLGLEEEEIAS